MFVVSWSVCSRLNHDTLSYLEHFYRKVLNQFYIIHTWTSNDRLSDVPHWQREDQPSEFHRVCSLGFHEEVGTVSLRRLFRSLPLPWDLGNTQAYKVKKRHIQISTKLRATSNISNQIQILTIQVQIIKYFEQTSSNNYNRLQTLINFNKECATF